MKREEATIRGAPSNRSISLLARICEASGSRRPSRRGRPAVAARSGFRLVLARGFVYLAQAVDPGGRMHGVTRLKRNGVITEGQICAGLE
jgi:hypothetical protein